jgi:hypothetical protein
MSSQQKLTFSDRPLVGFHNLQAQLQVELTRAAASLVGLGTGDRHHPHLGDYLSPLARLFETRLEDLRVDRLGS